MEKKLVTPFLQRNYHWCLWMHTTCITRRAVPTYTHFWKWFSSITKACKKDRLSALHCWAQTWIIKHCILLYRCTFIAVLFAATLMWPDLYMFTIKIEWLFTKCAVIFTNKRWWTCKLVTFTTKTEVVSVARVSLPFVSAPHLVVFTVIPVHTHCKTFELNFSHLSCMCVPNTWI